MPLLFCSNELKDGFHIEKKPIKYQTQKEDLRETFKTLTSIERLIYFAYKVNTLREISQILKKSHNYIRNIYLRAEKKVKNIP